MRAFVAVPLDAAARRSITRAMAPVIAADTSKARWVREENLHLTAAFLGRIDETAVPTIDESLASLAAALSGERLLLSGVGGFPRARSRVLWLGLTAGSTWFADLARDVRAALQTTLAVELDQREPSAHVTLARVEHGGGGLLRALQAAFGGRAIPSIADRLTLFSSVVGRGGPTYAVVREWPFAPRNRRRGPTS
jgi:2'-5' RNA ligase